MLESEVLGWGRASTAIGHGDAAKGSPGADDSHPTVKEADASAVKPLKVQVTVCVPVPCVVDDDVRYVQLTAPAEPAVSWTWIPAAVEILPDGSLAWAEQTAPDLVLAAT